MALRVLKPDTEADVADAVRDAAKSATPLALEGAGTKRGLGRPLTAQTVLKLAGLSGVTMYEPDELVFSARAGTTLEEIETLLEQRGQCLGFEPGDTGPLWGEPRGRATIGGVVAAALAGPRRLAAGAARDHLLGFTAVNGKGERFKAGGRVVKNVTGYDLPKLAAGSFGTLFAMTELTLRALPRGAASTVLAIEGLEPADSFKTLRAVAGSPFEPTGLSYLPATVAARAGAQTSLTLIRLDGQKEGVAAREAELRRTLASGAIALEAGAKILRHVADVHPLCAGDGVVWRVSVPPTRALDAIARLAPTSWFADAAGGVLWLEFAAMDVAAVARLHQSAQALGGHATLHRAPDALRAIADVFPPRDPVTMALTERLKAAFDPARILNPGRMYKDV
jgi:glycolate oxidase FAD binding subunit